MSFRVVVFGPHDRRGGPVDAAIYHGVGTGHSEEIRAFLQSVKAGYGYSSAACGGDLIFCECLLEMDAKVNLVLPCPVNAFKRQSVSFGGPEWERRFHDVMAWATTCLIANSTGHGSSHVDGASSLGLVYANRILTGLAALQAQALDLELKPVALWDGRPATRGGRYGSVLTEWERRQFHPHIVRTASTAVAAVEVAPPGGSAAPSASPFLPQEIRTMLFAEVVNFRRIAEHQLPAFVHDFKGEVARLVAALPEAPLATESAGGTLYFVFAGLAEAARLALDLRILRRRWNGKVRPAGGSERRIVLHAGVFSFEIDHAAPNLSRRACHAWNERVQR